MDELHRVVNELNEIINPIEIEVVENQNDANFIIYLTNENQYTQIEPEEKQKIINNWGLFVVHGGKRIHKGTMYVDFERCTSIDGQKHLLREELTQSLGLMNDSYDYPESIFYQKWSETTEYSPIDRALIDMLYNHW
jgi:hypothetical protein